MLTSILIKKLQKNERDSLMRERFVINHRHYNHILIDKKSRINFSHNDYLGLAADPKVKKAFIKGIYRYGLGSSSSSLISGYYHAHYALEEKFAEFLGRDRAILFNSGYVANLGVITTFANRHSVIISDKICHASLLDGALLSRAKHMRYVHRDLIHCESLLKKSFPTLLASESVFSMEGTINTIPQLAALAKKYSATYIVDDAHGLGVLGKQGKGIIEHYNLSQEDISCLISPLGKALGGMGAIVSGKDYFIETLIQFANTYRYTTALPPAMALAMNESLNIIIKETWRREQLTDLIYFFIQEAKVRQLPLSSEDITPIKSIWIGDKKLALKIKNDLLQKGIFVSCIRPPTVPCGTTRIRISLNCWHEKKDIIRLLDFFVKSYEA